MIATDLKCGDCGAPMVLRGSRHGPFYGCARFPLCKGTHGAHPDGSPVGIPASAEVRAARRAAHVAFDALWRGGSMTRATAYRWMGEVMGLPPERRHIGMMDADACAGLIKAVGERPRLVVCEEAPCTSAVELGVTGTTRPDGRVVCFACAPALAALPCDICGAAAGAACDPSCGDSPDRDAFLRTRSGSKALTLTGPIPY